MHIAGFRIAKIMKNSPLEFSPVIPARYSKGREQKMKYMFTRRFLLVFAGFFFLATFMMP